MICTVAIHHRTTEEYVQNRSWKLAIYTSQLASTQPSFRTKMGLFRDTGQLDSSIIQNTRFEKHFTFHMLH